MVGTKRKTSSPTKRRRKIQKQVRRKLKKAFPIAALGIELAPEPITDL